MQVLLNWGLGRAAHVETQFLKKMRAYVWATTTFAPAIAQEYTQHTA